MTCLYPNQFQKLLAYFPEIVNTVATMPIPARGFEKTSESEFRAFVASFAQRLAK